MTRALLSRLSWLCLLALAAFLPLVFANRTDDTVRTIQWSCLWTFGILGWASAWAAGELPRLTGSPVGPPLAGVAVAMALLPFVGFRLTTGCSDALGVLAGVGVALLAARWLGTPGRRRAVGAALVFSASAVAAYGYIQYLGFDSQRWAYQFGGSRPFSTLGNPNFLAGHFAALLPWAVAAFLAASDPFAKSGWLVVAFSWGLLVIVAQTRGAWIASAISLAFLFRNEWKSGRAWMASQRAWLAGLALLITAAGIGAVAANPELAVRIANLVPREFGEVAKRWTAIGAGLYAWRDRPLTGMGPGCFKHAFGRYMASAMPGSEQRMFVHTYSEEFAHNDFLQWLAENGVVGFGLLVWLLVAAVAALRRAPASRQPLAASLLACGIAVGVHGSANLPLHIAPTAFLFWLGIGLAAALYRRTPHGAGGDPAPWRVIPAAAAAVVVGMLGGMMFLTSTYARLGKDYLNFQSWRSAQGAWEMAARTDWDDRREAFYVASMMFQTGKHAESVPVFEREIARNPYYMDGFANLGSALGALSAEAAQHGDRQGSAAYLAQAKARLTRAIELNPAYAEAYANLGVAFLQEKKRLDAADAFHKALALEPGMALAESGLAQATGKAGGGL